MFWSVFSHIQTRITPNTDTCDTYAVDATVIYVCKVIINQFILKDISPSFRNIAWFHQKQSHRSVLSDYVFLEILQNSQESTCVRVPFLSKCASLRHRCFPVSFFEISKNTFSYRTPPVTVLFQYVLLPFLPILYLILKRQKKSVIKAVKIFKFSIQ